MILRVGGVDPVAKHPCDGQGCGGGQTGDGYGCDAAISVILPNVMIDDMGGIDAMITGTTVSNAEADGNELDKGRDPCRAGCCAGACRQWQSLRPSTS